MAPTSSARRQFRRLRATTLLSLVALFTAWAPGVSRAAQAPLTGVVDIEAGSSHTCALLANGGMQCWGWNGVGELGDGTTSGRGVANYVSGLSSGVAAIGVARAGSHSCAVMSAGGGVKCWGGNYYGQLGDGSTGTGQSLPVDVVGLGGAATAVALGRFHTCALMADETVKCWGEGGAVGHGAMQYQLWPLPIPELTGVKAITASGSHTCVLLDTGGAKCWGSNQTGQLGNGTTTGSVVAVDVAGLATGVAALSTGGVHSFNSNGSSFTCALTTAGGLKCWGALTGDASQPSSLTPFDVAGLTSGVAQVSTGGAEYYVIFGGPIPRTNHHACAVTTAGGLKCWGSNNCGQLGTAGGTCGVSTGVSSPVPQDVPSMGSGVAEVAAGGFFTCARMSDSSVRCWGWAASADSTWPVMSGTVPQAISLGPRPSVPVGGFGLYKPVNSGGSGIPLTVTSLTPAICSVTFGSSGLDDYVQVDGLAQGKCVFTADQAGNAYYDPAPQVTGEVRVGDPLSQTITFNSSPASVPVQGVGNLDATASSGLLPVTFGSTTPSICSVFGKVVTGLAVGQCTVTASQAGDYYYAAAPQVVQTFPVVANAGTVALTVQRTGVGIGTVTSSPAGIDCGVACAGNFASGSVVTLTATPSPGSIFGGWSACGGSGPCNVTMNTARFVTATFKLDGPPRVSNLSSRVLVGTGNDVMIGGFVIDGSSNKTVAIVATGTSLIQFGIGNPLVNPTLRLVRSSDQAILASNDDWQAGASAAQLEAIGLAPVNPQEAAILVDLPPGAYTAIVEGVSGGTGVAVLGVYEVDATNVPLMNLSVRGNVQTGDNVMIGGFVIEGPGPQTVAIVSTGPSLSAFGIANPLVDPTLILVRMSDQAIMAANDDWGTDANAAQLQAAGLAPADPKESALYVTLPPGGYSAIVRGTNNGTGVGVLGIYKVN